MFWTVLGEVITPGLGASLSPMLIVAAVLLACSEDGARKALVFAIGAFLALAGMGMLVLLVSNGAEVGTKSTPSTIAEIVRLILGLGFWWLAWGSFKQRPKAGELATLPGWMDKMYAMSTGKLLLLGVGLSLANVKNLPLTISTMAAIAQTNAPLTIGAIGVLIFAFIGSLGVFAPYFVLRLYPQRAGKILNAARDYLTRHNSTIMTVLFTILGANLVSRTLGPLFG